MSPLGRDPADRARGILAEVQDFGNRVPRERDAGVTAIRLRTFPAVGSFLMPEAMPLLRGALPDTKFHLREELTDALVEGMMQGRLDLLLLALPHPLPAQIETEVLFSDGYCVATPIDHPLGNRDVVGAEDLRNRLLLLLEKGLCLQRHALSLLEINNMDEDQSFSATSLSTLLAIVEDDLGITLLPKLVVDAGISKGHKLRLGDEQGARPREVALAWRKSSPMRTFLAQSARA